MCGPRGNEPRPSNELPAAMLREVLHNQRTMMATLKDIQDNEAHEGTALGQLATAVTGLKDNVAKLTKDLADALAGTTLPTDVQAAVDAAFAASKANADETDAILASLAPVPPAP